MTENSGSISRRKLLRVGLDTAMLYGVTQVFPAQAAGVVNMSFGNDERPLVSFPQKRPLIRLTTRPPQLETPMAVYNETVLTPNDAFFVRYHHAGSPPLIDPETYHLEVKGKVNTPLSLTLQDLKAFEPAEVVAVNQCSGNGRGLSNPRVAGGQFGNGAMGNARWKGVPLKAILDKAGLQEGARQVVFNGADTPVAETIPDYIKALDIDHASDGEVLLAYAMNNEDLPILNGYPLRLVVPGYYATYWIKHLNEITVTDNVFDGFWMKTAYRLPNNACACVAPGTKPASSVPINRMNVRSFITSHADGANVSAGDLLKIGGVAFDGGYGITEVAYSTDGKTWRGAELGPNLGKYSFRQWSAKIVLKPGIHTLAVRAINRIGQSQPIEGLWNPAGYMRNPVEKVKLIAS